MTTNKSATTAPAPALVTGPGVQVVAALLRRGDNLVLVQEQRDGKEMWSIPGGGVERGELLAEALVREVKEETGLNLTAVGQLAYLVNTTTNRYPSTVVLTFDCTEWDGEIAVHDPDGKVTGAVLLPLDEAKSVLSSSTARRPEIEPLLDYLDSLSAGRVWSYRDDLPIECQRPGTGPGRWERDL
ncbi:NUDIX domain-containing protein [Streptomyces graminilatus]|uniref:NUDIX domain-containing protein n=1 Tax=Streptomyces graminilatus TaxID=1464070 RepID=UPI0006E3DE40|nr:NUDIX hydrolase [Streptomyces graminilatus]